MALFCTTLEEVDRSVQRGDVIGSFNEGELPDSLPKSIGDWDLRLAPGTGSGSIVVAVPSGRRTREIYNAGRRNWLKNLGFKDDLADAYIRGSAQIMFRWEEPVARFVLANELMLMETWEAIKDAPNPRLKAQELGIAHDLSRPRLNASLNILINIWELAD